MAETTVVSSKQEFVEAIVAEEDLDITDQGAEELWRVWQYRYDNGAVDDVVVAVPGWFANNEFGKRWPVMFAQIEHDDDSSKAVLFDDARLVDVNVIENGIWDEVTISETLEVVDIVDENDYVDERGMIWIPRKLMYIYERPDDDETYPPQHDVSVSAPGSPGNSLTDVTK